jgi:hypothetical protein
MGHDRTRSGCPVNDDRISEYVRLCGQIAALDADVEFRAYARLDDLWYMQMTDVDRAEAEKRLSQAAVPQAWHKQRRTEEMP